MNPSKIQEWYGDIRYFISDNRYFPKCSNKKKFPFYSVKSMETDTYTEAVMKISFLFPTTDNVFLVRQVTIPFLDFAMIC